MFALKDIFLTFWIFEVAVEHAHLFLSRSIQHSVQFSAVRLDDLANIEHGLKAHLAGQMHQGVDILVRLRIDTEKGLLEGALKHSAESLVLFRMSLQDSEGAAHFNGHVLLNVPLLVECLVALGAVLLDDGCLQLEEFALREFKHGRFGQETDQSRGVAARVSCLAALLNGLLK